MYQALPRSALADTGITLITVIYLRELWLRGLTAPPAGSALAAAQGQTAINSPRIFRGFPFYTVLVSAGIDCIFLLAAVEGCVLGFSTRVMLITQRCCDCCSIGFSLSQGVLSVSSPAAGREQGQHSRPQRAKGIFHTMTTPETGQ